MENLVGCKRLNVTQETKIVLLVFQDIQNQKQVEVCIWLFGHIR